MITDNKCFGYLTMKGHSSKKDTNLGAKFYVLFVAEIVGLILMSSQQYYHPFCFIVILYLYTFHYITNYK